MEQNGLTLSEQKSEKQEIPTPKKIRGRPPSDLPSFPRDPLSKALKIIESIESNNAGRPFDRITLAKTVNLSPGSNPFRYLITSSTRYGLTEGGRSADKISLSSLGSSITAPTNDSERNQGLRQALLTPDVFERFYNYYNNKQLPREEIIKNTLKKEFHIAPEDADPCYEVLIQNITDFNLFEDIKGKKYLQLNRLSEPITVTEPLEEETPSEVPAEQLTDEFRPKEPPKEKLVVKQIFVAHGKNKIPLTQLEKILTKFKVNYKVANDEPHSGRPISVKIAELMESCTSGIFIFTADEETKDAEGNGIWRPSDNVVYELGAASYLYGNKIVIFKEKEVKFASDFSDLGYISFEKDKLDAKAGDLITELINLGFMQLTPT